MQASHSRTTRTHTATTRPAAQDLGERVHRFILAVLFTAVIAALAMVVVNRGPAMAEETMYRVSAPITQALQFAEHPVPFQAPR